jgi:hypothetical protein
MIRRYEYTVRLSLTAAALSLVLSLSRGDAFAQGMPQDSRQPTATVYDAGARIWRKITFGTLKGVNAYREALEAASIKIGDDADEILGRPAFPYSKMKTDLELAVVSVAELGIDPGTASLSNVYKRASQVGLELCSAEVGLQLRLDYRDQPLGDALHVAMPPVATYDGGLKILALMNIGSGLALIASDGHPDFVVPQVFRFVFNVSARKQLEFVKRP